MVKIDSIILGDCLDIMPDIADNSIDAVLCDLPYGVLNRKNPKAKWDVVIPFDLLWQQYERITKPNAPIILFGSGMFTADLMQSNRKMWRYNIIWDKVRVTAFLNAKKMPLRQHEDICVFYKKQPPYHPIKRRGAANHSRGHSVPTNRCYGEFSNVTTTITDEKYPTSIVTFEKDHNPDGWLHATQKPVSLCEYLIRTYTDSGGVILDNCMGSGPTILAAINANRHYIGIEKDPEIFAIAEERINAATQQLSFDLEE